MESERVQSNITCKANFTAAPATQSGNVYGNNSALNLVILDISDFDQTYF